MRLVTGLVAGLMAVSPLGAAKADTMADIRRDIAALMAEVSGLKAELEPSSSSVSTSGGNAYDRVVAIEGELQRLTGKTERLEFQIRQIVKDGTNRLGDLEFRVCEVEPGCDIGNLGRTPTLGSGEVPNVPDRMPSQNAGAQLAVGEDTDFRRAQEALAKGDFRSAANQFAAFRQTYPGSPLEPEVLMGQGAALEGMGDIREAARAYLNAYSGYPTDDIAPQALMKLGVSLGALGKVAEACVTLGEVGGRYPGASAVADAEKAMRALSCL